MRCGNVRRLREAGMKATGEDEAPLLKGFPFMFALPALAQMALYMLKGTRESV